jgi:hypothetical protein
VTSRLYYPNDQAPIRAQLLAKGQRFEELREDLLLGYCYNTARAYAADLDDIYDWTKANYLDIFQLTEDELAAYSATLVELDYSLNTVRRRRTAHRRLISVARASAGGRNDRGGPGHSQ